MTTLDAMNSVADAIRAAAADLLLEAAEAEAGDPKVPLAVDVGHAPPRNADMSAYGSGYIAPRVVVGLDETGGIDSGTDATVSLMVTVGTYSTGTTRPDGTKDLNNQGYIDLLLVIERIKRALLRHPVLRHITIQPPVRWGMYQDQPYPYWYGWLSFDAKIATTPAQMDVPDNFLTLN